MASTQTRSTRVARPADPQPEIRTGLAAVIYFALSLLYFLPAFFPSNHIFGTDYLAGGYFFYEFVSERFASGNIPGWVPYIYGGLPLAANPGSTFYPVRVLADVLFPVTWILPFIFVFQFGIAGLGMFLLARELRCRAWVAGIAGLAWEFTGITMSAVYAGHDGRVIVATFTPLLFYFLRRGIRTGSLASFAGAAATVGGSLLSFQIQSNYYLLLAGAIWAVYCLVHLDVFRQPSDLAKRVGMGLGAVAFGFVVAAVNFLPFIDYIPLSPRGAEGGRGFDYSISWSMPPVETLSLAVPEQAGILQNYLGANPFKLHTEYVGALVLLLLLLGFRYARTHRDWLFFGGLTLFVLTIVFGGYTPLYRFYYAVLPGTQMFRAPSIAFFLISFSLVTMAALTLEAIAERKAEVGEAEARGLLPWLGGFLGIAVVATVGAALTAGGEPRDAAMITGFGRFALFAAVTAGLLWMWAAARLRTLGFAALLAVITVADLWIIDRNFFDTLPPPDQVFAQDDVAAFLAREAGDSRTWVLPFPAGSAYRGGGNYLMLFDLDQAGGEHGNQLQRYNEFVGAGEEVYVDWSNFLNSPNFLAAAGVRYIVSMAELPTSFLREVYRGSALIYENVLSLPRAHLVGRTVVGDGEAEDLRILADPAFDPSAAAVVTPDADLPPLDEAAQGDVQFVEDEPDRVALRVRSSGAALVVLADNYYPGWRATVNGESVSVRRVNHTFRGVPVPAGDSEVVFEYAPGDLRTGFYLSLIAMLLLAGYGAWQVARSRRNGSEAAA